MKRSDFLKLSALTTGVLLSGTTLANVEEVDPKVKEFCEIMNRRSVMVKGIKSWDNTCAIVTSDNYSPNFDKLTNPKHWIFNSNEERLAFLQKTIEYAKLTKQHSYAISEALHHTMVNNGDADIKICRLIPEDKPDTYYYYMVLECRYLNVKHKQFIVDDLMWVLHSNRKVVVSKPTLLSQFLQPFKEQ